MREWDSSSFMLLLLVGLEQNFLAAVIFAGWPRSEFSATVIFAGWLRVEFSAAIIFCWLVKSRRSFLVLQYF